MNKFCIVLSALFFLYGCVTPEVLAPRDGTVPAGVDLSGTWRIRSEGRAHDREIRDAIRITDGVRDDQVFRPRVRQNTNRGRRSRQGSSVKGGLVYVFLELGDLLKVTQTASGLFISFDRSVVEEYRFGEIRPISLGEVQAQRVTGWDGNTLIIETLGRQSMKLTERLRLLENDTVLERSITFRSKKMEEAVVVQTYDRSTS